MGGGALACCTPDRPCADAVVQSILLRPPNPPPAGGLRFGAAPTAVKGLRRTPQGHSSTPNNAHSMPSTARRACRARTLMSVDLPAPLTPSTATRLERRHITCTSEIWGVFALG